MTMYSGDFVEVQGTIQFSINYVQRLREFHIFVAECRDLAAVDPKRNRSDPSVQNFLILIIFLLELCYNMNSTNNL